MKTKILISIFLVSFALFSNAQPVEIKGLVTFKTIRIKKGVADTVTTKGARALISLFNKSESKLVSISEDNGEYFFDLDFSNTPYTHIQFLNMEGGLITFPLSEIKMPFFDIVITHTEGVDNVILSEQNKSIAPSTLNAPPIIEKPVSAPETKTTPETKPKTTPAAILETEKSTENTPVTPTKTEAKSLPNEEVKEPLAPTPGNLFPDEPSEDEIDPETEKLNKELKELEEELKRLEKEKEKQTIEAPN